jgi:tRNA(Ile)-lysidine synthase
MNLPIHFLFIKEYNNITIQLHSAVEEYSYQINQGETFECEYFSIKSEGSLNSGIPVKEEDFPLTIRNMKPGDRIVTAGGTKKVSRLFIDAKIPKNQRRIWPVVLNCKGEVLLVPEIAKRKGYLSINPYFFVIK